VRNALESWDEIERRLAGRRPAVFLDYDGTLAPIAARPELATLPEPTRAMLRRLAGKGPVAILSGRGREDVAALVGLDELTYAGSHGFDIAGPTLRREIGEGIPERIEEASEKLRCRLDGIAGVLVEPKRFSVAVHFRLADPDDLPRIESAVDAVQAERQDLRKVSGKKVFELRPCLDWDKGHALLWLLETLHADADVIPFYLGDDVTDEDAFRVIADRGIGILVAEEPRETVAAYSLRTTEEVREFLEKLAK
jgi:trehalose-phosphatase